MKKNNYSFQVRFVKGTLTVYECFGTKKPEVVYTTSLPAWNSKQAMDVAYDFCKQHSDRIFHRYDYFFGVDPISGYRNGDFSCMLDTRRPDCMGFFGALDE